MIKRSKESIKRSKESIKRSKISIKRSTLSIYIQRREIFRGISDETKKTVMLVGAKNNLRSRVHLKFLSIEIKICKLNICSRESNCIQDIKEVCSKKH